MKQFIFSTIFLATIYQVASFPSGKIVNGKNATKGQFPFHVVLAELLSNNEYDPFCGGSLIHPSFVLTAAHCVQKYKSLAVIGGIVSMKDRKKVMRMADKVVPHEEYQTFSRDIAIIKLDRPMKSRRVKTIKLPPSKFELGKNSNPTVVGFGQTSTNSGMNSVLAFTSMTIMNDTYCSKIIPEFQGNFEICTRYVNLGSGPCGGDSGGALIDPKGNVLLGLLNYGDPTCKATFDVFAKVSAYIPWIQNQMKSLS